MSSPIVRQRQTPRCIPVLYAVKWSFSSHCDGRLSTDPRIVSNYPSCHIWDGLAKATTMCGKRSVYSVRIEPDVGAVLDDLEAEAIPFRLVQANRRPWAGGRLRRGKRRRIKAKRALDTPVILPRPAGCCNANKKQEMLAVSASRCGLFYLIFRGMVANAKKTDYECPICQGRGRVRGFKRLTLRQVSDHFFQLMVSVRRKS